MARIVTRVTSKNFCITNPAFELSNATDTSGNPMLKIEKGQACINGMDLIINQSNRIYPPDTAGTYYIALHLWRDSSANVLGDLTVGVTKQFKGVYLDWWDSKDENDVDALWLGKVVWDGTSFTSIEEDLDKYGRLWARDILCKIEDWKHPATTRILLQDWLYKVPDWYVSKEGDVVFGPIEFLAGRNPNKDGTLDNHEDLGTGKYGTRIEAVNSNSALFTFKAPSVSESDTDRVIRLNATNTGISGRIASATFSCTSTGYNWSLSAKHRLDLNGVDGVTLSAGANKTDCKLTLDDNVAELSDATCTKGTVRYTFAQNSITEKFGNGVTYLTDGSKLDLTITGNNTNTIGGNLTNTISGTLTDTVTGNVTLTTNSGNGTVTYNAKEFHVSGDITASKVWNAVYNGFGEIFRKDKTEDIEYGDLVCIRQDGLVHKVTTEEDIATIVGICSNTVGIGLGGEGIPEDEQIDVEMVGQVWVKTSENLEAGKLVKALPNGTVGLTTDKSNKIGVTLTSTINGKVRIVFNG